MTSSEPEIGYADRVLQQLLRLRGADALPLEPVGDARGVHRYRFRAGGWPIVIDLDTTVLEVRAYHGRHTLATGRVPERLMHVLVGAEMPAGAAGGGSAEDALAELRAIVAEWKARNPRVFMEPPRVARHPDGWNNS